MKKVVYALVALVGWVGMAQAATNVINIGDAELLYSDAQIPFTMDASFATLRLDSSTMEFFQTDRERLLPVKVSWIIGLSAADPRFQRRVGFQRLYTGGVSGPWLGNIYDDGSGTLIGLIHTEDFSANTADFTIGLAKSTDGGANWKYLGDVLSHTETTRPWISRIVQTLEAFRISSSEIICMSISMNILPLICREKEVGRCPRACKRYHDRRASDTVPVFHKYAGGV